MNCQHGFTDTLNNWLDQVMPTTYYADMQTIITAAKLTGDVLLVVPVPTVFTLAALVYQQAIQAEIYALSKANNVPILDMTKRWVSYANKSTLYSADGIHPTAIGYSDEASAIAKIILQ